MKILHFDCSMGAAGDMIAAALLDLAPDKEKALADLNSLGVPHTEFSAEKVVKCGIQATMLSVKIHGCEEGAASHCTDHGHTTAHLHHHHHHHHTLEDIRKAVTQLSTDDDIKTSIMDVYAKIAEAESIAHGKPVAEIHFHEVGALDAIADIAATCYLMQSLRPCTVTASNVNTGSGTVLCAHGEMPVPAPATAILLRGVPSYSCGHINGELCTPTGAALLKHFVSHFSPMPLMRTSAIGCGAGKKDFPRPNILRIFSGESGYESSECAVVKLEFEVDDMTGEETAFAAESIFQAGALDVSTSPVFMKKGRPGTRLTILCREETRQAVLRAAFTSTTTLGVRESVCLRHELARREETFPNGGLIVKRKIAARPGGDTSKIEFDSIAAFAKKHGIPFRAARTELENLCNY
jgi:uncharacterized protein (TIGR00299 family) protein